LTVSVAVAIALAAAGTAPQAVPSVAIVEFPRGAAFFGLPLVCPGSPPDSDRADQICLSEVYQGRVRVVRHLSGPRLGRGTIVRLKAHARQWGRGTRMLVAAVPFEDGRVSGAYAYWWDLPEENGDFCEPREDFRKEASGNPLARPFEAGYRRRFRPRGFQDEAEFLCIATVPGPMKDRP